MMSLESAVSQKYYLFASSEKTLPRCLPRSPSDAVVVSTSMRVLARPALACLLLFRLSFSRKFLTSLTLISNC